MGEHSPAGTERRQRTDDAPAPIAAAPEYVRCPHCRSRLDAADEGFVCEGCHRVYPETEYGQPDLRLREPKAVAHEFTVGGGTDWRDLPFGDVTEFPSLGSPRGVDQRTLSRLPDPGDGGVLLDLGCGSAPHRSVCEDAGWEWVGLDVDSAEASVLGDAHALPFADDTFDAVLTVKVFEHLDNPYVAAAEAARVLKPGGRLVGSVAFAEPFHGNSVYHHSPVGVFETVSQSGLTLNSVTPGWNAVVAQAQMVLFPLLPNPLVRALVAPLLLLHRLWYWVGDAVLGHEKTDERFRRIKTAGEFHFVATK
jgi:SAM-dependent methyltransferase